tara:strand:- start:282 stop:917 length:636 start_codon:yes stop_codon:yes gene_type:complete
MIKNNYFATPIYCEEKPEWLPHINNACDPYLKETKKEFEKLIKERETDYGFIYHSLNIAGDIKLKDFCQHVGQKSADLLMDMGYSLEDYNLHFTEMWVQEFPKEGGGRHAPHVHPNNHVSGFYFLETKGSYPIFYDPRTRLETIALPQKNKNIITNASPTINLTINPGTLIIIPSYIMHEYSAQRNDSFKFIHFNIKATEKRFMKGVEDDS